MPDPKPFASLSPTLLARKGTAKPAMRPLHQFQENAARQIEDDLGWNDMGHDHDGDAGVVPAEPAVHLFEPQADQPSGEVVAFDGGAILPVAEKPEVLRQHESILRAIEPEQPPVPTAKRAKPERVARLAGNRRAAFTLRLDTDRHLKLRLASTVLNRSAQQLVTEALDRLLDEMPEITSLATRVRKQR